MIPGPDEERKGRLAGLQFFWVVWDESLGSLSLLGVCEVCPEEGHAHPKAALSRSRKGRIGQGMRQCPSPADAGSVPAASSQILPSAYF